MARNEYKKLSKDDADRTRNASFVSLLFFQWMNSVFKTGSERPLEEDDFLPLPKQNISGSLIEQLQTNWNDENAKSKANGKKPKLWKSVMKMLSATEVVILLLLSSLYSFSRIIQPLFLGYLMSTLMSAEPQKNYLLYGCAFAMGVNALMGCLSMHHTDYRCELLSIRLSSALKGLVYLKVSTNVEQHKITLFGYTRFKLTSHTARHRLACEYSRLSSQRAACSLLAGRCKRSAMKVGCIRRLGIDITSSTLFYWLYLIKLALGLPKPEVLF